MSTLQDQRRIVVGVDGSPEAVDAVRWAAAEAERRGAGLRLVTAVEWLDRSTVGAPVPGYSVADRLFELAATGLEVAEAAAKEVVPDVAVDRETVVGFPVAVLASESRGAGLLVVGAGQGGRIASALAGSTAVGVAIHAACPVVVVRGENHGSTAPVVVGVDASPRGEAVLAFAFEAAAERGVPLVAVHTWGHPPGDARTAPMWSELVDDAERDLAESLAGWGREVSGPPRPADRESQLSRPPATRAVGGSAARRRRVSRTRRAGGLILSSVSNAMVHGATCPVAVVRPPRP